MRLPNERTALAFLLLAGAALRLWQYFAKTSLWIDEIALAENVIHTPLFSLLGKPLAFDQVASPGLLAALKGSVEVFGPNELALRLFPLLGGLAALALFALLSVRVLPGWTAVLATALFTFAPSMIVYSAEAKQYSTDVAATLLLTLVALRVSDAPQSRTRLLAAGLIGMPAVWFSQPAALTVVGLGAGLAWIALRRGGWPALRPLLPVIGVWGASAGAAAVLGFHSLTPATREYMQRYWEPSLPRPIVVVLVLLGSVVLWKKRPHAALLLVGPAAVALAAAAAHRYPFSGRAILFLTPVATLAIADAVESLVAGLARLRVPRPVAASLFALTLAVATAMQLPVYRKQETRPVLEGIAARRRPGDALYVYYGAERAVRFYGPRVGIEPSEATFGGCHRGQPREYLRELDRFRGHPRVWVVFTHAVAGEQPMMLGYLRSIGRRREGLEAVGATAELYDLSEPGRLQNAAASTYPLASSTPDLAARVGCGHGPLAGTPPSWR